MGELTQKILQKIDDAAEFDDIRDWIWMAGELLRHAHSSGYRSGFEEIDRESVSHGEQEALRESSLRALTRNPDPMWVGSFLSVLRDSSDQGLLPLWIEYLTKFQTQLKQANAIVFTILLALKDLNQPVFTKARSLCSSDVEQNISEADKYLRQHNILIPG